MSSEETHGSLAGMQQMPREKWVDLERTARPCGPLWEHGGLPKTAAKPVGANAQSWGVLDTGGAAERVRGTPEARDHREA